MSIVKQSLVGASGQGGGYTIDDSLRFRSSADASLARTFSTPTDGKEWTYSVWVKRAKAPNVLGHGVAHLLCTAGSGAQGFFGLGWNNADDMAFGFGGYNRRYTTGLFRDPSAWYHILLKVDTTQATEANRALLYVNGALFPWTTQNAITQNSTTQINQAVAHSIGDQTGQPYESFDGYLTEVNFIDGQALDPTDFGEFDEDTGVWKAKKYTGTYGTNGFYIDATTSGSTVLDQSGNSNNWTASNMNLTTSSATTYDLMKDTPSLVDEDAGNFATLNPLDVYPGRQFAVDANLKWNDTSGGSWSRSTVSVTTGKWYWEVSGFTTTNWFIGVSDGTKSITNYYAYYVGAPTALVYLINGNTYIAGSNASFISAIATTDVVGFVVDADAGSLAVYKNNVLQGTITGLSYGSYSPMVAPPAAGSCVYNFGQRPLAYTPPTGSKKLNTFNLPDSTIEDGSSQFNTVLYTGDNTSNRNIPTGFPGGWTWIKNRNLANSHTLSDVVRGDGKTLFTNSTNVEVDYGANGIDLVSDGFDVTHSSSNNLFNVSGRTYVAWNWKANGSGVSNTDGLITSTVSVNTTAGFSIVTYTGTGSASTVGHGLGVAPSVIIAKQRNVTDHWTIYHKDLGKDKVMLFTTNAAISSANYWGTGGVTSTVFGTKGASAANGVGSIVACCFAPIEGYSAFGSYTGNGSADGAFIYTGFRPAWVLIKQTNSGSFNWNLIDTSRSPYNTADDLLAPNTSGAEVVSGFVDAVSNGFKCRNASAYVNGSGSNYIYMAFAENPFKNANAR